MAGVILLVVLLALGAAAAAGRTPDSRDPRYGVGPVVARRPRYRPDQISDHACSG